MGVYGEGLWGAMRAWGGHGGVPTCGGGSLGHTAFPGFFGWGSPTAPPRRFGVGPRFLAVFIAPLPVRVGFKMGLLHLGGGHSIRTPPQEPQ